MDSEAVEAAKRRAGESAAAVVADGDVVGLGTGSTAAHAIRRLGERVDAGLDITGIPTSHQARETAREAGVPLTSLDEATPDVAIDGADQVATGGEGGENPAAAAGGTLLKGGGGAHAREKVVDAAADRLLVVVDERKETDAIDGPVPLEVLPAARPTVADAVEGLGGTPTLRRAERKDGPVVTDNGNLLLDCDFGRIDSPASLAEALDRLPGVLAHGLFLGLADEIHVGTADGVTVRDI